MKKVTKYQSDDGNVYDTKEDAFDADLIHGLANKLDSADIYWRSDVDTHEVAKFILSNYNLTPRKK